MADTHNGKIGRLPHDVREQLNARLLNGETGATILPWLNGLPEVLAVLDQYFHEQPVTDANLTNWRQGGYQNWLARREKIHEIKSLAEFSLKLGEASGGSITDGSAAIAGGRILTLLETSSEDDLGEVIKALGTLRRAEIAQRKVDVTKMIVQQRDRALSLEEKKFQRTTAEMFLKWYDEQKARDIVGSRDAKEVKMAQLVQLMFGERPESTKETKDGG